MHTFSLKRFNKFSKVLLKVTDWVAPPLPFPPTDNICNSTAFLHGWLPLGQGLANWGLPRIA